MQEIDPAYIDSLLKRHNAGSGDVRISLVWHTRDDLDLHVITPSGERIWYENRTSSCCGMLDVDMNRDHESVEPVENVFWPVGQAPQGTFKVIVKLYKRFGASPPIVKYHVRVENRGEKNVYRGTVSEFDRVATVTTFQSKRRPPSFSLDLGSLYNGSFELNLEVLDVTDHAKMRNFAYTLLSSLGACANTMLTPAQMSEVHRLRKI